MRLLTVAVTTALTLLVPFAVANPQPATSSEGALSTAVDDGAPYCPPRAASAATQSAIFSSFIQKFLIEKNATRALLDHAAEDYIQHNPSFLSGRQVAIDALSGFPSSAVNYTIINQGFDADRGWVHYRLDVAGATQPSAVVDIFRLEGTCVREHWDVMQQRPENATNPLAMW
ncbi:snoal-like polyketide cyclase family protein [Diplodia corticola]|uniref:Snoal-like polyketide cyclase family protein n=1 Tax=Diplodia corticola TaxID=236234 RepID=A0A1J9QLC1_9PEZI|nr:snoal-like polyketide cyclase family protein [Diplodia corticola]OJD29694.1 snoal-like polyketide cyclase family protein [Diplodia corticola]